jgi:hypothetical protein
MGHVTVKQREAPAWNCWREARSQRGVYLKSGERAAQRGWLLRAGGGLLESRRCGMSRQPRVPCLIRLCCVYCAAGRATCTRHDAAPRGGRRGSQVAPQGACSSPCMCVFCV